ncbi:MAG: type II toxin-antitoxin system Phd/YefM family antitoxin [Bacteroidetes bacterium]|uniref:Antitoxin n=1 Tax=Candidatus Enterocola intestinipullorum TaxID=2840783 RepID=A0A9D9EF62_9BACT|nr:type II toxin-antitoxin system Phd/YefM family antitoxin [Candidatus Enterocola intestinipullorum]
MLVVSAREFRENQKSYLDQVINGVELLITRGKKQAFKILPVTNDDTLMSKEEFFAKLDKAKEEIKEGKTIAMEPDETLEDLLNRIN